MKSGITSGEWNQLSGNGYPGGSHEGFNLVNYIYDNVEPSHQAYTKNAAEEAAAILNVDPATITIGTNDLSSLIKEDNKPDYYIPYPEEIFY